MDANNTNTNTNSNSDSDSKANNNPNNSDDLNADPFVQSPFQQWEIAFIYAFITTFNPQADICPSFYKLPNITPEELEAEIVKKESQLIHQFICASLSNALNRKKAIESYNNAFSQIVADKYKTFDLDLDYNPLSHVKFTELDPNVKLLLLRSLVEWQLQDSQAIKTILEHCNTHTTRGQTNPIHSTPIGIDSKKRSYWQFGESPWVWREKMQSKPTCHWETVCKNRAELEQLVEQELSTSNRAEKQLIQYITENLYDLADKAERRKIRKEQAELRKLFPPEVSITSSQLRSRTRGAGRRINYNIDDAYDFVDEDEDYEEDEDDDEEGRGQNKKKRGSNPAPPRTAPTRWSSRLNDTDDARWQELEENEEMDEKQQEEFKDEEQELEIQVDDEDEVMGTLKSDISMIDVINDDGDDISISDTLQQQEEEEKVINSHSHSPDADGYKSSNDSDNTNSNNSNINSNSNNSNNVDNMDLMEIVDSNSQYTVNSMSQD